MMFVRVLGLCSLLPLVALPLVSPVSGNEDTPSRCFATAQDLDGDGFGWQRYETCVVDSITYRKPALTNLETGTEVPLTRPYWNGNRDIANRNIDCRWFDFDAQTQQYLQNDRLPPQVFKHALLPYSAPYIGDVLEPLDWMRTVELPAAWTVSDGFYKGPMEQESRAHHVPDSCVVNRVCAHIVIP
jgi:hypothetical protein